MKKDSSRDTFDARKHHSRVLMQQGRVQLDADWNEQGDIVAHRIETETSDIIGVCGGPLRNAAFEITADNLDVVFDPQDSTERRRLDPLSTGDFHIGAGRYYVDGLLCENEQVTSYLNQPDLPDAEAITLPGVYMVYVDVWQRHLTALDDPSIREIALGGPDTATRAKIVWQVKYLFAADFAARSAVNCLSQFERFDQLIKAGDGKLSARTNPEQADTNPCLVPPGAGYIGLENQLYRVEIHQGGPGLDVTSGEAGTPVTRVQNTNDQITVSGGSWEKGRAVEMFSSKAGSDPMNGTLAFITNVEGSTLTLNIDVSKIKLDELRLRNVEAIYKWSRNNGVIVTTIESINDKEITVHDLGPDEVLGFKEGQWVEIIDDGLELNGQSGQLALIATIDPAINLITLTDVVSLPGGVDKKRHPKIRGWDGGVGAVKFHPNDAEDHYLDLENGVQVSFSFDQIALPFLGTLKTGDYWTIPARTATADAQSGNIEWPHDTNNRPVALLPFGIKHHYCRLAMAHFDGTEFVEIEDCRHLFPPVTELTSLFYVSGDGQEAMPNDPLPQLLQVGVFNGRWPVAGASVHFSIVTQGSGVLAEAIADLPASNVNTLTVDTGPGGIASCAWRLDPDVTKPSQQVEARLLDASLDTLRPLPPVVRFNGNLSIASQVSYDPAACPDLSEANVTTVQQALDALCQRKTGGGCTVTVGKGGQFGTLEDAFTELRPAPVEAKVDICICLLPGDHRVDDLTINGKFNKVQIKIEGCGHGSRILLGGRLDASVLVSFTLRDVEVFANRKEAIFTFDICDDITFEGCYLHQENQAAPFITISHAKHIRFEDNVIETFLPITVNPAPPSNIFVEPDATIGELFNVADRTEFDARSSEIAAGLARLAVTKRKSLIKQVQKSLANIKDLSASEVKSYNNFIATLGASQVDESQLRANLADIRRTALRAVPGTAIVLMDAEADTWIEDNNIDGIISLYGVPGKSSLTKDEMTSISRRLKPESQGAFSISDSIANLQVRDNVMYRIVVSEDTISLLQAAAVGRANAISHLYRRCFITDNVFSGVNNNFVMEHLALTSNSFEGSADAGLVIAVAAIYVGNYAPSNIQLFNAARSNQKAANLGINIADV